MTNGLDLNIQHCRLLVFGWALVLRWRPLALKGPPSLGSFPTGSAAGASMWGERLKWWLHPCVWLRSITLSPWLPGFLTRTFPTKISFFKSLQAISLINVNFTAQLENNAWQNALMPLKMFSPEITPSYSSNECPKIVIYISKALITHGFCLRYQIYLYITEFNSGFTKPYIAHVRLSQRSGRIYTRCK